MEELYGKTLTQLKDYVVSLGLPKFTGMQLAEWMYQKGGVSFEEMTNISKKNRTLLQEKATITRLSFHSVEESTDGTKKYLFPTSKEGKFIEAVYIPDEKRHTLCISSQIGCAYRCAFCMTGRQGLQGQLSAGEILNQIMNLPEQELITNIVLMGMGEPLDNAPAVMNALEILTAEYGLHMSSKRFTLSTIGLIEEMQDFLEQTKCHLAISIHSPFDKERQKLMPVQKKYPIAQVLDVLRNYDFDNHRRVSFEYILFEGLNDSKEHINELARILNGINCRVNLMRFHPIPGSSLKSPREEVIESFRMGLIRKGITATVRTSRGLDIAAACGMLSTKKNTPNEH